MKNNERALSLIAALASVRSVYSKAFADYFSSSLCQSDPPNIPSSAAQWVQQPLIVHLADSLRLGRYELAAALALHFSLQDPSCEENNPSSDDVILVLQCDLRQHREALLWSAIEQMCMALPVTFLYPGPVRAAARSPSELCGQPEATERFLALITNPEAVAVFTQQLASLDRTEREHKLALDAAIDEPGIAAERRQALLEERRSLAARTIEWAEKQEDAADFLGYSVGSQLRQWVHNIEIEHHIQVNLPTGLVTAAEGTSQPGRITTLRSFFVQDGELFLQTQITTEYPLLKAVN